MPVEVVGLHQQVHRAQAVSVEVEVQVLPELPGLIIPAEVVVAVHLGPQVVLA